MCANYRPLTLLSIPSKKKKESVICESFDSHLRCVLQRNQWGYRKGLSSESLSLYLTEMWKLSIDNGKVIGAIFIDFRKAFDSIDHNILGYKLQACVITCSLWEWFLSCLTNRHQFVEINGTKSNLHEVEYWVPQSFLVGPGLLSIYVNDFSESVLQGELHMYADDATAFVVGAIQTS